MDRGLVDRIVEELAREGAPRSSADLARRWLGLGVLDEETADRVLGPVLGADPRLARTPAGWCVREGSGPPWDPGPALAGPFVAGWAPSRPEVAGVHRGGGEGRPYGVTLRGDGEARRVETRLGRAFPRPVIAVLPAVRVLRGYRGTGEPVRIAEFLGVPHVDRDGPAGRAEVLAATWEALAAELALEGVTTPLGLASLVTERREPADLAGRRFGPEDLDALPEGPGVYLFRDGAGAPLYAGQSGCLRARVRSYFTGMPRDEKDREIRREADRLEVREEETGLAALVREARLIRRLAPRLNRRREVRREPAPDGILWEPRAGGRGALLWVVRGGVLVDRVPLAPGPRRGPAAIERAVRALLAADVPPATPGEGEGREAASLVETWRRTHPWLPFLEPGVDGGPAEITARLREIGRGAGGAGPAGA